jgi:signal transduction histidine kinase
MPPLILNVDDYGPGRYSRTRILQSSGFEVLEAGSGAEALALVGRNPGLVILDVNLPDINGFEVCRRIKQNEDTASIVVLHLSASRMQPEDQSRGLDNGADGYLTEPVQPDVLIATIRALLRARQAESELRTANRNLVSLTDMLSHELRQSLRGVSIFSQLLHKKMDGQLAAEEQRYLDHIRKSASQLEAIVEGSLAYFMHPDERQLTSTAEQLDEAIAEMKDTISESGAEIHVDTSLPMVEAGPVAATRLFSNLILNAIKYRSAEPPQIHISAEAKGDFWQFSVKDNGIGIAPEYHTKIFEIFQRLHGSERDGIGVGLALCKRLVEHTGGRIWVESEVGAGSTFQFTLPAVRAAQDK